MKNALIFSGGWEGHQPQAFSDLFAGLLRANSFQVEIATSLEVLLDVNRLRRLDLIVPNWTMGEIPRSAVAALNEAVQGGTGLAGWHGGMGDAFRNNCEYQFMVGGQFVAHPGDIKRYTVTPLAGHPITAGLPPFEMNSEQYYMHVDPSNHILATTVIDGLGAPWTQGTVMPVAWMRQHGQGRVAYCALGHKLDDFDVAPARELTLRGLLWAAHAL